MRSFGVKSRVAGEFDQELLQVWRKRMKNRRARSAAAAITAAIFATSACSPRYSRIVPSQASATPATNNLSHSTEAQGIGRLRIPDAIRRHPEKFEQTYYVVTGQRGRQLFPPSSKIVHTSKALMIKAYGTVFTFRKADVVIEKRHVIDAGISKLDVEAETPFHSSKHADDAIDADLRNIKYSSCPDCVSVAKMPDYKKSHQAFLAMLEDISFAGPTSHTAGRSTRMYADCYTWDPFYYTPLCDDQSVGYVDIGLIFFPSFFTSLYGDAVKYDYTSNPRMPAEGLAAYEIAVPSVSESYTIYSTHWELGFDSPLFYSANAQGTGPDTWEYVDWYGEQGPFTQTTMQLLDINFDTDLLVYRSGGAFSWGYKLSF